MPGSAVASHDITTVNAEPVLQDRRRLGAIFRIFLQMIPGQIYEEQLQFLHTTITPVFDHN
ncbi:MAG: hypothetical protein ABR875_02085 [Minisyncoccia bacterium]